MAEIEGRGTILELADDFAMQFAQGARLRGEAEPYGRWVDRYPEW